MTNLTGVFAITLAGLLAGCSPMPASLALDSPVYNAQNAGLVTGTLIGGGPYGTYLEFRNMTRNQVYGWGARKITRRGFLLANTK
jgi:hypothetical protein